MIRYLCRCHPGDHYDIPSTAKHLFLQPVWFSHQPCNMMSYNTVSYFFAHWYSNSVPFQIVFQNVHNKIAVGVRHSILIYILEITVFFQRFRKFHAVFLNSSPCFRKSNSLLRRKTTNSVVYADNLFLPFNLLAAKTFLPPLLLILARNPWTLDLDLFFGWNVIFMVIHLLCVIKTSWFIIPKNPPKSSYFGSFLWEHDTFEQISIFSQ